MEFLAIVLIGGFVWWMIYQAKDHTFDNLTEWGRSYKSAVQQRDARLAGYTSYRRAQGVTVDPIAMPFIGRRLALKMRVKDVTPDCGIELAFPFNRYRSRLGTAVVAPPELAERLSKWNPVVLEGTIESAELSSTHYIHYRFCDGRLNGVSVSDFTLPWDFTHRYGD